MLHVIKIRLPRNTVCLKKRQSSILLQNIRLPRRQSDNTYSTNKLLSSFNNLIMIVHETGTTPKQAVFSEYHH